MTRIVMRVVIPIVVALLAAGGAAGQPTSGLSTLNFSWEMTSGSPPGGIVDLNGERLMTIQGLGWASATAAKTAAEALQSAALQGSSAEAIRIERDHGGYAIVAGAQRVVLVDNALARALNSTPEGLARDWATRLREVFAGPYASLAVDFQIVPVGERRTLSLRGNLQAVKVTADGQIIEAAYDPAAQALSIAGVAVGGSRVIVGVGTARLILPVQVMKYAARVSPTAAAAVTGRTAPAWAILQAASAALYNSIAPEPGAWAEILSVVPDKQSIRPGERATVDIAVMIRGAGYLPVRTNLKVRVVNQAIPSVPAEVLMVSNRPERLPSLGLWYQGRVPEGHPARLLYHHVNATGAEAELAVELLNTSGHPVRVQIVEARGGPSDDEIFAGHKAAREFLERQAADVGYVVSLPDGCSYTLSATVAKAGLVVSGLAEVRVLDPGELLMQVRLRPPTPDLMAPISGPTDRVSSWVFSDPIKRFDASYSVGQQWCFVTVGDGKVLSVTGREALDGDYGVFYEVLFKVDNPTAQPADVELVLMPGGGLARAVAIIEGRICETGLLRYGEAERLYGMTVAPGARREVRVRIMPEAGSNYPVKLVMRPKGVLD